MSKKTLYFDGFCGYFVSAASENGKICDFHFEKLGEASIVGNIYKGRVEKVLPGMNAAFVNCGLEKNCYLSAEDVLPDAGKYDGENRLSPPFPDLREGDEVLVQAVKPPVGGKGAKVTLFPSFVGKSIIYMPRTPFLGVSARITDAELRKNLMFSGEKIKEKGEGLVFRTAAPYLRTDYVGFELNYMRKVYAEVENAFKTAKTGDLLFTDWKLPQRVLRDTLLYDLEKIYVGTQELKNLFSETLARIPNKYDIPVILHDSGKDMFDELGIAGQILSMTSPQVPLENGGNIVIERTEALTVIDVNTGKFTGDDSLEQTVYYTNILAAREIARQVRLRNVGGIIVADFIDMSDPLHRKALTEELERALSKDGAKFSLAPMSKFGLVEFTRKRTGHNFVSLMTRPCKYCKTGYSKNPRCVAFILRAEILAACSDGAEKLRLDISAEEFGEITSWKEFKDDLSSRIRGAKVYLVPHSSYRDEKFVLTKDRFTVPDNAVEII